MLSVKKRITLPLVYRRGVCHIQPEGEKTMSKKTKEIQEIKEVSLSDLERDLAGLTSGDGFANTRSLMQQMSEMDQSRKLHFSTLPACNSVA